MPIRPELRRFYGSEWRAYRATLIDLTGRKCQQCGLSESAVRGSLNAAHVTHDPRNGALVAVWCPSCHARHDAPHRVAMMRRSRARRFGQLWLLPEIEFAPFPAWMIPRSVLENAQESLPF